MMGSIEESPFQPLKHDRGRVAEMKMTFRMRRGVTLVELLISLAVSGILVAALYRAFAGQQKNYAVQEQVVDIQQNVRVAINRMMRETRMAGFGNVAMVLPITFSSGTFNNILNPDTPAAGSLTLICPIREAATLSGSETVGGNQIIVSRLNDDGGNPLFDTADRKYISIGGVESHTITSIESGTKTITLNGALIFNHAAATPVFGIRAISFQVGTLSGKPVLLRDEHTGDGGQPEADGIEDLQFQYLDASGNPTGVPADIRIVRVSLTARTETKDPELKAGDGYWRRRIASNIHLRNMGLEP